MRARVLAILLVVSMWPSAAESAELVVHWARFGDIADAQGDRHGSTPFGGDEDHGCTEHGCTPMFHLCSCHNGAMAPSDHVAIKTPVELPSVVPTAEPMVREGCADAAPALRPPIV